VDTKLHVNLNHFGSKLVLNRDDFLHDVQEVLPEGLKLEIIEDYQSDYGHLLPDGIGGDDFGFLQVVDFVVGLGTVDAFKVFAAAFLGRTGYLLADRLFKPMSKEQRQEALEYEKAQRKKWREQLANQPSKEDIDYKSAKEWGERGETLSLDEYHGCYSIRIYIKDICEQHEIRFSFGAHEGTPPEGHFEDRRYNDAMKYGRICRETFTNYSVANSPQEFAEKVKSSLKRILSELD
jgi:hypothetical protein